MRKVYPHYYKDFKCIAGDCPDTCCAGWQIVIDEKSLEKYEQYVGHFSTRLEEGIDWSEGVFYQDDCKRCSMLNKDNLCDMVLNMGENHLCKTCDLYPRHEEEFEGVREWSLSLSCPVAAHMILSCKEPVNFIVEENDDDDPLIDEFEDFDFLLFSQLEDAREVIYKVVQNRDLSINDRLKILMKIGSTLQVCLEENRICDMQQIIANVDDIAGEVDISFDTPGDRYSFLEENFSIFSELELLREDWQEVLDEEEDLLAKGSMNYVTLRREFEAWMGQQEWWPIMQENYLMSFIYTYFCGAVYDDWIDTKLILGVFSLVFTEEFIMNKWLQNGKEITPKECEVLSYRYVREVEHSDLNLNALEEFLHEILFSPA